jgi:hypothetical protein
VDKFTACVDDKPKILRVTKQSISNPIKEEKNRESQKFTLIKEIRTRLPIDH